MLERQQTPSMAVRGRPPLDPEQLDAAEAAGREMVHEVQDRLLA